MAMDVSFVEFEAFTKKVAQIAEDETLRDFQNELAANPESGDIIPGSGGLRKARFKLEARGRSQGARVIYLWLPKTQTIILFTLYTKAEQTNISSATLKILKDVVETIKSQYTP